MLDTGYERKLEFVMIGKNNASYMFRSDMTEERYMQNRDNNLLRHLVNINLDVSNVRADFVGTTLTDTSIGASPKFIAFCQVCKSQKRETRPI
jgi:hypothetical protein